jgi:hypothetical protein
MILLLSVGVNILNAVKKNSKRYHCQTACIFIFDTALVISPLPCLLQCILGLLPVKHTK